MAAVPRPCRTHGSLFLLFLLMTLILVCSPSVHGFDDPLEELIRGNGIDALMDSAVASGLINGGTVLVGNSDTNLFVGAYGRVTDSPLSPPVRVDTLFDLASLTKVVATAPSIMKLVDEGKLELTDPVSKWLPEFASRGKDGLLIFHLLTHTSGLTDFPVSSCGTLQGVVEAAAQRELNGEPGSRFRYADINFILLGEVVRRVSGMDLPLFAMQNILLPLGMVETAFNPDEELRARCASTVDPDGNPLFGTVQDPAARFLGGAAGNAGLFGTAADLSRYCRMMLRGGELDGRRIFSQKAFRQMITPFAFQDGKVLRGVGWDIDSPYSSPRGTGFSDHSFGHTAYTGCSIWIDPVTDLYVIILTSRRDHRRIGELNRLRGSVSTLAAALFSGGKNRPRCRIDSGAGRG